MPHALVFCGPDTGTVLCVGGCRVVVVDVDEVGVRSEIDLLHLDPDARRLGSVIPRFDLVVKCRAIVIDKTDIGSTSLDFREIDISCCELHQYREVDKIFGTGTIVEGDLGSVLPLGIPPGIDTFQQITHKVRRGILDVA